MRKREFDTKMLVLMFWVFFKVSSLTFAGGLAMLPAIQKDLVEKHGLLTEEDFIEAVTLSQALPGMVALNCAVFIGSAYAGLLGAIAAGLGALLPAFVAMLAATLLFTSAPEAAMAKGSILRGALSGIRVTSAALILYTAFSLGRHVLKNWFTAALMAAAFVCVFVLKVDAFPVMLAALLLGLGKAALFDARRVRSGKGGRVQ